jgi:hypothetical protein
LDYSGANIKMRVLKDVEYVPYLEEVREEMRETQEFID